MEQKLELTVRDRIILANQFRMLMNLYPEESDYYGNCLEVIEHGYEREYPDIFATILESRLSIDESGEIMDILEMYRVLNHSYSELSDQEGIDPSSLIFPGFDANHNSQYVNYTEFLVKKQDKWTEVLDGRDNFDFNSHIPNLDMYRRMLEVWRGFLKGQSLTRDQILSILNAQIHPENQ